MMLWLQDEDGNPAVSSLWDGEDDEATFKEKSEMKSYPIATL